MVRALTGKEIRLIEYREWTQTPLLQVASEIMNLTRYILRGARSAARCAGPRHDDRTDARGGPTRRLGPDRNRPRLDVADGINAARTLFSRMWFDEAKCAHGLECLRNYAKAWDEKRKVFQDRPFHNWASHGADALRYWP